jgi:hypothetical protein
MLQKYLGKRKCEKALRKTKIMYEYTKLMEFFLKTHI